MALRIEECNIFLRGNFNPYVVTPEWLAQQNIWRPKKIEVYLGMPVGGVQFRGDTVTWEVDSDRLVISSSTDDCGKLAADVLKLLPHTPLRAVGSNFKYVSDKKDWGDSPLPKLGEMSPEAFPDNLHPDLVRWSGVIQRDDLRTEITLESDLDGVAVQLNFHRPAPNATHAADAALKFTEDRKMAAELLKTFFDKEVSS